MEGNVFNIQRYSIHDGRGIRTIVFLKGCPLRCKWCSNPESQIAASSLFYSSAKCIKCHTCVAKCPNHEITANEDGSLNIDWEACAHSDLSWVDNCPTGALSIKGRIYTVDEVIKEIRKDAPFYEGEGGVTFSGGEPLLQAEFVKAVAEKCLAEGITTAMETAGNVSWDKFELVRPYINEFLFDIKIMDPEKHKKWIGVSNDLIKENLQKLAQTGADVMVRTPLIPDVNDSEEDVEAIMDFVEKAGVKKYDILPFHQLGASKYTGSGMDYELRSASPRPKDFYEKVKARVRERGFSQKF